MPRPLMGATRPRIWTPPLRKLTPRTSSGYAVIEFARSRLGIEFLPWQKFALIHGCELRPGGDYRFRTVLLLVSRQNGKTTLPSVLSLHRMRTGEAMNVLGTSTNLEYAWEAWENAGTLAEEHLPEMSPHLRRAILNPQLTFRQNRARYKIAAATRRGGRSLSVDLGIVDELREHTSWAAWAALSGTTTARPKAQIWALSNAGDDSSVVLNRLREAAIGYIETGEGDDSLGIFEWSAPDDCDLDDPRAWAQANPSLGRLITERTLQGFLSTDPPNVFRTEHLCQRVIALDNAIDLQAWGECGDSGTLERSRHRVALVLDVAPDLAHVSLVAAAVMPNGRIRGEVVAAWDTTSEARADLPTWMEKIKPAAFGWFANGPAAALAADLRGFKKAEPIGPGDVPAVCQGLAELVLSRRLLHNNDPLLTAQVGGATRMNVGDGWRFVRRGAGHCDAVYALAGAAHLARALPPPRGRAVVL